MSLRGFHLVFITFVTLLFLALTVWCFAFAPRESGWGITLFGIVSACCSIVFPFYGYRFYQKAKKMIL
jgi:hypothetical protein